MKRNEEFRADDINRGENPDKNRKENINKGDHEMDVNEERERKHEKGQHDDKENKTKRPE